MTTRQFSLAKFEAGQPPVAAALFTNLTQFFFRHSALPRDCGHGFMPRLRTRLLATLSDESR